MERLLRPSEGNYIAIDQIEEYGSNEQKWWNTLLGYISDESLASREP
jgi:hypothetical protein